MRSSLLVLVCSIGVVSAAPTYSQQPKLDVAYRQERLSSVLNDLRSRSGMHLVYSPEIVSKAGAVTLERAGADIEEILNEILPVNGLAYTIEGDVISIIRARTDAARQQGQSRPVVVRGNVSSEQHARLAGVSVMVAGSNNGTVTDAGGNYVLRIPGGTPKTRIRFTMVGMAPFETELRDRETINVIMVENTEQISEVVVTGILDMRPNELAGSQQTLAMDSIRLPHLNNITDMLQGQVPGMMVKMSSVRAGAASNIMIRGQSTLLGSTAPLFVVDGIIQPDVQVSMGQFDSSTQTGMNELIGDAVSWLNPYDVETITVLKDASATAIYGSRASNGVIVITTKKGRANQNTIRANYNVSVGQKMNYGLYNLMNSKERINFSKYAFEAGVYYQDVPFSQMYTYEGMYNKYLQGELSEQAFIEQYKYLETINTDWLDLLTRPSLNQNLNVNASGGSERFTYTLSGSYANDRALEKGNGSERFTGRAGLNMVLSDKVTLNIGIVGSLVQTEGYAGGVNPIGYATTTSRAVPAYDPDGSLAYYRIRENYKYNEDTKTYGLPYNILDDMDNTSMQIENPQMQANADLKWVLLPGLTFQTVGGIVLNSRTTESWMGENSLHVMRQYRGYGMNSEEAQNMDYRRAAILKNGGILIHDNTYTRSFDLRTQLNFRHQFENGSSLTAMAMWQVNSSYNNSKYNTVFGYDKYRGERIAAPTVPAELVPIGNSVIKPSDYSDTYLQLVNSYWRSTNFTSNKASVAAIVAYTFKGKYVLNMNMRNDWSNAFGQNTNKRFNPAWSAGVAWRFGDEEFLSGSKLISTAVLRLTYGTQGNVASTETTDAVLGYKPIHSILQEPYSNINRIANPYKSWERTTTWNAGLDLGLLDNKIRLVIDGYTRLSDAGRNYTSTPEMGGFSSTLPGTLIRNSGIEGIISMTPINRNGWHVSISANASKNWNKLERDELTATQRPNLESYINGDVNQLLLEGYPLGAFWAYPYAGPDPETGIPTFHNFHTNGYTDAERAQSPIDILKYMGSKNSDITSGININVSYKRLSLNTSLVATLGGKAFLYNPYAPFAAGKMPDPTMNLNKELLGMWTKDNPHSAFPGLYIVPNQQEYPLYIEDPTMTSKTQRSRYDMWARSDARVASLSTLRCRNISANWNIDTGSSDGRALSILKSLGLRRIQLSASVSNLFLIADSKWQGFDPDMGGDKKAPRTYTFGINLGF